MLVHRLLHCLLSPCEMAARCALAQMSPGVSPLDLCSSTMCTSANGGAKQLLLTPGNHPVAYSQLHTNHPRYDARLELPGWVDSIYNDSAWQPTVLSSAYVGPLQVSQSAALHAHQLTNGGLGRPRTSNPFGERHLALHSKCGLSLAWQEAASWTTSLTWVKTLLAW